MSKRLLLAGLLSLADAGSLTAAEPFVIRVLDEQTGRGVPLVELRTVNDVCFWTDSAGVVAFDEPGLVGREVFFHVTSPGYEFPKDGFGIRGLKLDTAAGGKAELKVKRVQIAERLYRITGAGIYRDSILAGLKTPRREPLLNGGVLGQDTVSAARYRGKLYWFYGDTNKASYPLGNFGGTGAVSERPGSGGLDPSEGVDLTYFTGADGFARPMFPQEEFGEGLQWIEGEFTIQDEGREKLIARVASGTGMSSTREWHLAVFDDAKGHFVRLTRWDSIGFHDSSHAFRATVNGVPYIYLFPDFRVPARLDALRDLASYEAYTCVAGTGKTGRGENVTIDRDDKGPLFTWKRGADRLDEGRLNGLTKRGLLQREEWPGHLTDIETGKLLPGGRGSVFWNAFRRRWIMVVSGVPGEVWFSEADSPTGPWLYARRVVTHGNYNFYNPTQHPFFDQENGRIIYLEGTYTDTFSGAPVKTPRYDYNQMMYRLTLDDVRLTLPCPVYRVGKPEANPPRYLLREGVEAAQAWGEVREAPFCAVPPDRKQAGLIPVWSDGAAGFGPAAPSPDAAPLFLALPPEDKAHTPPAATEPLQDAAGKEIARVWKYSLRILPLDPGVVPEG